MNWRGEAARNANGDNYGVVAALLYIGEQLERIADKDVTIEITDSVEITEPDDGDPCEVCGTTNEECLQKTRKTRGARACCPTCTDTATHRATRK